MTFIVPSCKVVVAATDVVTLVAADVALVVVPFVDYWSCCCCC